MASLHVLCPVDFSDGARTALRYAAVIAQHLEAQLTVLTVNDPLLVEGAHAAGEGDWPMLEAHRELRHFCREALEHGGRVQHEVRVGPAAAEIVAMAAALPASLIVMGAHGLTGFRKLFFGSTAERVLRDTTVPVLITPTDHHAPASPQDLATLIRRIVVPVDLSSVSVAQVEVAAAVGAALHVPLLILHAIEPVSMPMRWRTRLPNVDTERRSRGEAALAELRDATGQAGTEVLLAFGEPAEEVAKVTAARAAGLVVMGLQASGTGRVGSVTYRVLSLARVPVLALPPASTAQLAKFMTPASERLGVAVKRA